MSFFFYCKDENASVRLREPNDYDESPTKNALPSLVCKQSRGSACVLVWCWNLWLAVPRWQTYIAHRTAARLSIRAVAWARIAALVEEFLKTARASTAMLFYNWKSYTILKLWKCLRHFFPTIRIQFSSGITKINIFLIKMLWTKCTNYMPTIYVSCGICIFKAKWTVFLKRLKSTALGHRSDCMVQ